MSCVINEVPAAALNVGPVFDREVAHGCSSPRIAEHPQRTPSRILFAPFWRLLYVSRILFAVSHPPRSAIGTAARAKKPDRAIKRHGRWKSTAMLDRYIADGTRWEDNASVGIGL
jgi:hypothetical protein